MALASGKAATICNCCGTREGKHRSLINVVEVFAIQCRTLGVLNIGPCSPGASGLQGGFT